PGAHGHAQLHGLGQLRFDQALAHSLQDPFVGARVGIGLRDRPLLQRVAAIAHVVGARLETALVAALETAPQQVFRSPALLEALGKLPRPFVAAALGVVGGRRPVIGPVAARGLFLAAIDRGLRRYALMPGLFLRFTRMPAWFL